jgi:quercetin dioxygenase-like cupin family protein
MGGTGGTVKLKGGVFHNSPLKSPGDKKQQFHVTGGGKMDLKRYFFSKDIPYQDLGNGVKRRVLAWHENLMIVEHEFDQGAVGAPHQHPHEQITYVVEGEFDFTIAGETKRVASVDSMYKEPNVPHCAVCVKKGKLLDIFSPCRKDFL